jgi:hypothetical protein
MTDGSAAAIVWRISIKKDSDQTVFVEKEKRKKKKKKKETNVHRRCEESTHSAGKQAATETVVEILEQSMRL